MLRPRDMLRAGREGGVLWPRAGEWGVRLSMSTAAIEDVWHEMHAPLLRFIERRVNDPRDAEDVLQDVMVRIQSHADELDQLDHLGAWVHQVTRSAVVDFYRRRAARPELAAGIGHELSDGSTAGEADRSDAAGMELAHCLRPLIARLPDKYREALELTELEGISQVAAAERLGLSVSGMKARVQRARVQLRDLLLACCHVELDRRGGVAAYHAHARACDGCSERS